MSAFLVWFETTWPNLSINYFERWSVLTSISGDGRGRPFLIPPIAASIGD
jgi:hypothetical protein